MTETGFRSFMTSERQKLTSYVRGLIDESADMDAEDIVHDVLVKLLEKADPTVPMEYLAAYVYRSLRNRVIDRIRTRKPSVSLDGEPEDRGTRLIDLIVDDEPDPLQALRTREDSKELFAALEELGEMERRVIIAHEFEGTAYKDLSKEWNVPVNTLMSHKSRGLKKLKTLLSKSQGGTYVF